MGTDIGFYLIWYSFTICNGLTNVLVFDNTEDRLIFEKAIVGINNCAILAASYELPTIFDYIVMSLAKISGLHVAERSRSSDSVSSQYQHPHADNPDLWAVEFGKNFKSQIATVIMFQIVAQYPLSLREGWNYVRLVYYMD